MYEFLYLAKSLVLLTCLLVIKSWSFGGFGLDKTYVLLFFSALSLALPLLVIFVTANFKGGCFRLLQSRWRENTSPYLNFKVGAISPHTIVGLSVKCLQNPFLQC